MEIMKGRNRICFSKKRATIPVFILISFLIIRWTNSVLASPEKPSSIESRFVPAHLVKWPEKGSDYAILVDKSEQKVLVYHRKNPFAPVRAYQASTGENDGPKSRLNDMKTPEGIYFFTRSYVKSELPPIYGSRAFPIDYPNPIDKKMGRNGYGIWFHGLNKPLKPKDTNGCIALENPNIDDMANYIQVNDTPVIISSKIEMVNPHDLEREKRELVRIIEGWRRAWENEQIDRYMSFYSRRFTSSGRDWHQWKMYKARLAKRYKRIRVEIDNLTLLKNDGIVLAKFDQRYSTDRFLSMGEKRLYLQQNSREWKITGEFFKLASKKRVTHKKPVISDLEEIKGFISAWKKAWEEKNLKAYISFYDPNFRSRGMDIRAWEKHRKRLNRKYRSLKIAIRQLSIVQVSKEKAKVSFVQSYQADAYRDYGLKKLLIRKRGRHWKIREEKWRPMKKRARP